MKMIVEWQNNPLKWNLYCINVNHPSTYIQNNDFVSIKGNIRNHFMENFPLNLRVGRIETD